MNISDGPNLGRAFTRVQNQQQTQQERIASGKRINAAKDDAAGLAISTGLTTQNKGMQMAIRNSYDGISRLQVEDGALSSVTEDLQRIRELKVQQQNGILSDTDRNALQGEIDQRFAAIETTFEQSQFNGKDVFEEGSLGIQTGPNSGQKMDINTKDLSADLGLNALQDITLDQLDDALTKVASRRSDIGAMENRLSQNVESLALRSEHNQAANSRIQDTDFAKAISEKSKSDIQSQVLISVQGQANANKGMVLQLLK